METHVLVAFLGYALWVTLKQTLRRVAPLLTPWQTLELLGRLQLIEVWFQTRDARALCLLRITEPDAAQAVLLPQLGWHLPDQPPPKIYQHQVPNVWRAEKFRACNSMTLHNPTLLYAKVRLGAHASVFVGAASPPRVLRTAYNSLNEPEAFVLDAVNGMQSLQLLVNAPRLDIDRSTGHFRRWHDHRGRRHQP